MRLKDIPPFTGKGKYQTTIPFNYIETWICDRINQDRLDLNPDFQRGHVWDKEKQIAYVEYLLRKGEFHREILFNHPGWFSDFSGQMVIVDGLQRLTAVRRFLRNELPVFGYRKKEWEDSEAVCKRQSLTFRVNDLKERKELLKWYLDINSGGVIHTEAEIEKVKNLLILEEAKRAGL